jgi:hypothetical protein
LSLNLCHLLVDTYVQHPPPQQAVEITRVGQNCICTPYMTVCMIISLHKIPFIHRTYVCMYGSGQPYKEMLLSLLTRKTYMSIARSRPFLSINLETGSCVWLAHRVPCRCCCCQQGDRQGHSCTRRCCGRAKQFAPFGTIPSIDIKITLSA